MTLLEGLLNPAPDQTFQEFKKLEEFKEKIREKVSNELGVTINDPNIIYCVKKVAKNEFLPEYFDCLLYNRVRYLECHIDGLKMSTVKVPQVPKSSNWHLFLDTGAINTQDRPWEGQTFNYRMPGAMNGHTTLNVVNQHMGLKPDQKENLMGQPIGHGFIFLYQLYTKTVSCKVGKTDCSFSFARLFSTMYSDMFNESTKHKDEDGNVIFSECPGTTIYASILSIIGRNPQIVPLLPKFKDNRTQRLQQMNGFVNDQAPISPIKTLMEELMPILQSLEGSLNPDLDPSSFKTIGKPRQFCEVVTYSDPNILTKVSELEGVERTAISPQISNFLCASRTVEMFDMNMMKLPLEEKEKDRVSAALSVSEETVKQFGTSPLADLLDYVKSTKAVDPKIPFDISGHSYADSKVAKDLIKRLEADREYYADLINKGKMKIIKGLNEDVLAGFVKEGHSDQKANIDSVLKMLSGLRTIALGLKKKYDEFVDLAIPVIVATANYVDLKDMPFDRMKFLLNRHAHRETTMWINYLIGSLISDRAEFDLRKLNPYLEPKIVEELEKLIMMALLHANRHGQTNEVLGAIRNLERMLITAQQPPEHRKVTEGALEAGLLIRVQELARLISKKRYYVKDDVATFDPRYLLFEFTWNITLRERQVEIVDEFYSAIKNGTSLVKQMIMGAGKTTVVSPLINLMVADGKTLMVQVVPPQLLEFSRGRLRETFSSIMQKRI